MLAGGSCAVRSLDIGTQRDRRPLEALALPHSAAVVRDIENSLITANMQSKTGFSSSN